jgi:type II secretory pathway pseudopilin PulG
MRGVRSILSRRQSEAGDTLIEILIAIVVLGVASVALLLAFGTSLNGSATHRSLATFDTVLKTAADEVTSQLQQQSNALWGTCSGASPSTVFTGLPTGYSAQVTSVQYWNGTSFVPTGASATWGGTSYSPCIAYAPELVKIAVTYKGTTFSISSVIDNPWSTPLPNSSGPPTQLVFLNQPGSGVAGQALTTQPVVAIENALGNPITNDAATVTLTITTGTGTSGATLTNCTGIPFSGVVTFSNCGITTAGSSYKLSATDVTDGVSGTSAPAFNVTPGAASQLVVTSQPGNGTGESVLSTQPAVTVEDAFGNVVTTDTSAVVLGIGTNPSGGTLNCTTDPVAAVGGLASFAGCKIDKAGTGYTLTATDGALTSITTSTFNVTVGAATQLSFTTQPGNGSSATILSTQPVVTVQDAGGNTVTSSSASVTLAISSGTGTLACTSNPHSAVSGIDAFSGCKITLGTQGSFTLKATATGLATANSATFTVAGTATKVVFTTQPGNGSGGSALTTQPVASVEDSSGDLVTTSAAAVTLAINTGTGTLACTTNPVTSSSGTAAFAGCKIALGTQGSFTLKVTSGSLTFATSTSFTVAGSATKVAFITQPAGATGGTAFTTQPVVVVEDSLGDVVTSS